MKADVTAVEAETDVTSDQSEVDSVRCREAEAALSQTDDDADAAAGGLAADDSESVPVSPKLEKSLKGRAAWSLIVLPALAMALSVGAGYLKWQDSSARIAYTAGAASVQAAKDITVALLSYRADSVEKDLAAARGLLTGQFRDSYTSLTNDVVIPGAKQKQITAVATVPAAASVSASENHAVVMAFVNTNITTPDGAPTATASTVKVTLDKVDGRWLVSGFDPI